jgi:hypothetical protein
VAAYDGYLTRLPEWRSAVIIRIPRGPHNPGRQIWTHSAHMADPEGNSFIAADFPPGTYEQFVRTGTLLGYQGNFRNEGVIANTLDPAPYLGLSVPTAPTGDRVPTCLGRQG